MYFLFFGDGRSDNNYFYVVSWSVQIPIHYLCLLTTYVYINYIVEDFIIKSNLISEPNTNCPSTFCVG